MIQEIQYLSSSVSKGQASGEDVTYAKALCTDARYLVELLKQLIEKSQ